MISSSESLKVRSIMLLLMHDIKGADSCVQAALSNCACCCTTTVDMTHIDDLSKQLFPCI
jgi:hypothetical protein